MEYQESINHTFLSTITKSELGGVTIDLAEVAIDVFVKEGVLKDVPILGTLIGLYKGSKAIRDHIFLKKIIYFLSAINEVPASMRENMFAKLEKEGHSCNAIGETMLLILDKVDSYKKAELLGLLLKALSISKINYSDFERFSSVISNVFIQDLLNLPQYAKEVTTNTGNNLEAHSLIVRKSLWVDEYAENYTYSLSSLGERFCVAIEII
jgi:hypothetical protein